jgi:hypothetical protein
MNSYIKKYEFISTVTSETYEFISPGDLSFHAYEFICIRRYIKKMATGGGGGEVDGGSNPHPDTIFFANFHLTAILAISTYIKPNI